MYRRGKLTFIAAGCAAALGALLLIPGNEQVAVADAPIVTDLTSQETLATIDAMLGVDEPETAPAPQVAAVEEAPATPLVQEASMQPASLTTPEQEPPAEEPAAEETAAIDPNLRPDSIGRSAVNLRAGPSTATASITVLQPGQAVHVGEDDDGWVEVTLPDGTTGWVFSRYLASVAPAQAPAAPKKAEAKKAEPKKTETREAKAKVQGGGGNLEGRTARIDGALIARAQPDGDAKRIFRTSPGERVKILDSRGKWLRILTADGSTGWIQRG
ncbi:MAG TPA: SH3 domain-containing protein [Devosia sp.]|nr:SH3 domain-containing protein [Devosia sp.]